MFNIFLKNKYKKGSALVEVMVACSIFSILSFSLISATNKGINLSNVALRQVQASFLLEEGAESVKIIRDNNWSNISGFSNNTNYYTSFNTGNNTVSLSTTPNTIDSFFTRTIVFSAVSRDSNDDIATSGTVDPGTKKVTVTVSWPSGGVTLSKSLSFYVANIFN
ncbi:MAG: hypothetical protein WC089_02585 [Candidatus Paceibacterota bacterium]